MTNFKKNIKTFLSGFVFGFILQIAIGPVCLYVLKKSLEHGFIYSEKVVFGAFLIDALYIFLAVFGISSILKNSHTKRIIKLTGFLILLYFGINIIISQLININLIPANNSLPFISFENPFFSGIILTLSNPLTVIFWIGLFSAKTNENKYTKNEISIFGLGALIPTIIFLTFIAASGTMLKRFLSNYIIILLNIFTGILIIFFAFKLLFNNKTNFSS